MLAFGLAVVSAVCLGIGWFYENIVLVYVALGASCLGIILLVLFAIRRYKPRWLKLSVRRKASSSDNQPSTDQCPAAEDEEAEVDSAPEEGGADHREEVEPAVAGGRLADSASGDWLGDETAVCVLPGRKRFHVDECRLIAGRSVETLTVIEALEEAFTPCSVCLTTEPQDSLVTQ